MPVGVLFVCLGNICRSPIAQGILEKKLGDRALEDAVFVDSCGTAAFNIGKSPDPRAVIAANNSGYNISRQIARQVDDGDYRRFHYIVAMDRTNLINLQSWAPADYAGEIKLLLDYCRHDGSSQIPDPYYDSAEKFAAIIPLLEPAIDSLLDHIRHQHSL